MSNHERMSGEGPTMKDQIESSRVFSMVQDMAKLECERDALRTRLQQVEIERDEAIERANKAEMLLAEKNETADTFMNQVKKLHKNLEGAQLVDGTPFCFRCKAYHLKDQQCLMPR